MIGGLLRWLRSVPAAIVGLLALFALYKMEGSSIAVPIWAALILASAFVPARLPDTIAVVWLVRVLVIGFAFITNLSRSVDIVNVFDTRTMTWFGELCAAELALACWVRSPNSAPTRPLWLSGLVMLAASSTSDDTFMVIITPAFFFALLVALRSSVASEWDERPARMAPPWRYGIAVACALLGGGGISALLTAQRSALSAWGMQFFSERVRYESSALSLSPVLTSTFGQRGSMARALRIEGEGDFSHLRGIAFTNYQGGVWGPRNWDRVLDAPITTELEPVKQGPSVRVTRLLNNHGIVFTPLNASGLRFMDGASLYRTVGRGGLIRTAAFAPSQYDIVLAGGADFQGPVCIPPAGEDQTRLLAVPNSVDPRVRKLCAGIIRNIADPRGRIQAIEQYLVSHHSYSLRVNIGRGDPVSNFLLERKAAHCEFFASAAVILARLAGVPSRYVIGYLAHEREGNGVTIVRQRDAHAWAECWLPGTGWVVLDATPSDGRPDALTEQPSPFERGIERLQDWMATLRLGARSGALLKLAIGVIAGIMVAAAIRALWMLRARMRRRVAGFVYASPDAELFALFRQFERVCRARGLVCPAGQTWLEFLDAYGMGAGDGIMATPDQVERARTFVRFYNAVRFRGRQPVGELAPLRSALARMAEARSGGISSFMRTRRR
jgi:hypothetical protein